MESNIIFSLAHINRTIKIFYIRNNKTTAAIHFERKTENAINIKSNFF